MIVLAIDDKQEELERAQKAIIAAGHEPLLFNPTDERPVGFMGQAICPLAGLVEKADLVLTDLHFPLNGSSKMINGQFPPSGLLVVIECLFQNKSVCICTDGDHHKETGWIFDSYISQLPCSKKMRFWLSDQKNWSEAINRMIRLREGYQKHGDE